MRCRGKMRFTHAIQSDSGESSQSLRLQRKAKIRTMRQNCTIPLDALINYKSIST